MSRDCANLLLVGKNNERCQIAGQLKLHVCITLISVCTLCRRSQLVMIHVRKIHCTTIACVRPEADVVFSSLLAQWSPSNWFVGIWYSNPRDKTECSQLMKKAKWCSNIFQWLVHIKELCVQLEHHYIILPDDKKLCVTRKWVLPTHEKRSDVYHHYLFYSSGQDAEDPHECTSVSSFWYHPLN